MFELVSLVLMLNNPNPIVDYLGVYDSKEECIVHRDLLVEYSKTEEFKHQIKDVPVEDIVVGCVAKDKSLFL